MYRVTIINQRGVRVPVEFTEYPAARKFYFKCKHSKLVEVASINFDLHK